MTGAPDLDDSGGSQKNTAEEFSLMLHELFHKTTWHL